MEAQQVNQVFDRVSNCINSSTSLPQLETAERLMDLFRHQHSRPELNEKLNSIFITKAEAFHYFEWKKFRDFGAEAA